MKSKCKFFYAIGALIALKLLFLSFIYGMSSGNFGIRSLAFGHPMQYLFQLLFFLFIISPPLIVVLLYLIWKELKERNKMK